MITKRRLWTFVRFSTLLFFTYLMLNITVPYISLKSTQSFLQIKQWIIDNDIWRIAFFIHVFSSIFLLFAGFTQFRMPANPVRIQLHRSVGKSYVFIILFLSGPTGFIMAIYANGGIPSQIAFGTLDLLWLYTTAKAWTSIRGHDLRAHKNYMLRSYALTLSAVTLRAWKFMIVIVLHPHPMDAYRVVAWLGWVPNILLAEFLIYKGLYPDERRPVINKSGAYTIKISDDD